MLADSLLAWCLFAYLVAAIPIGLLIGRVRGVDLRAIGSGNIGATNAVRALGKKWGALVFLLDVLKAYLPVRLAMEGFGDGASEVAW
ncbi:MAG: glycerol-3-phosphate acyltransferase, partial [Nannocystaceae bacterium]